MTAKRPAPQGDSYVSVFVATGTSRSHKETNGRTLTLLEVVDPVPMETKMVMVEADAMAKDIAATGHVAGIMASAWPLWGPLRFIIGVLVGS